VAIQPMIRAAIPSREAENADSPAKSRPEEPPQMVSAVSQFRNN
jgi:hypothetical protein